MKYILPILILLVFLALPVSANQMQYYNETTGMMEIPIYQGPNMIAYVEGDLSDISIFDTIHPLPGDKVLIQTFNAGWYWNWVTFTRNITAWDDGGGNVFFVPAGKAMYYERAIVYPVQTDLTWDYACGKHATHPQFEEAYILLLCILAIVVFHTAITIMGRREGEEDKS